MPKPNTELPEYTSTTDEFILNIRQGYPLNAEQFFIILRFLVIFTIGCKKYKIESNFEKRLNTFISDLHQMGYQQSRISAMVRSVCNCIQLD